MSRAWPAVCRDGPALAVVLVLCSATHHVDDLREGDLEGDVERPVRVFHGAQGAGVVGEEVVEQLVGEPALGSPAACGNPDWGWKGEHSGCSQTPPQGPSGAGRRDPLAME